MKKLLRNIPNILSGYRLLVLPVIGWTIWKGERDLYALLMCISLVTDILDGLIARTFKLQTEFGAKLDSTADMGTYAMAFCGFIFLEKAFVHDMRWPFFIMLGFYITPQLLSFIRFRRNTSFHLYSSKITGYLQGIFLFTYFVWGYQAWYFWLMWTVSILAYTEALIIVLRIPQLRSNVKGLYWILKEKGKIV
ncbi:MAG: CDP-diacylglycerol--glycerol-3-phosphate 3-phosphatidyltransferase [Bacteroidetes bacterium]|nr:MAG: CDP-diacylglycerol--glycerol-3-phosphate 3-phosphatidyltransferase [Bacteroidota bacterium]